MIWELFSRSHKNPQQEVSMHLLLFWWRERKERKEIRGVRASGSRDVTDIIIILTIGNTVLCCYDRE
jgi:hypothetical protein